MLCQRFQNLAASVWNRSLQSYQLGIPLGEQGITDYLLIELALLRSRNIRIGIVSGALEARIGCDWEWWIGSGATGWIRYAIQAKKYYFNKSRYEKLSHVTGAGQLQIDLLENYAIHANAVPLYCLYNYFDQVNALMHWHCQQPFREEFLGCSLASIQTIRAAIANRGQKSFDAVHRQPSTLPWHCIVCCHPHVDVAHPDDVLDRAHHLHEHTPLDNFGNDNGVYIVDDLVRDYPLEAQFLPHYIVRFDVNHLDIE
jgi:hypothetical protein